MTNSRLSGALALLVAGCTTLAPDGAADTPDSVAEASLADLLAPPVGLGLYTANGVATPDLDPTRPTVLHVVDGPRRYLQELYLVATAPTTPAAGLAPLMSAGDFARLDWTGVAPDREDWRLGFDGATWIHETFYRGAVWMRDESAFAIVPRDAAGHVIGLPIVANAGRDDVWRKTDTHLERRFVARVITQGCPAQNDCSGPGVSTSAEALVQLRGSLAPELAVPIPPATDHLDIYWSQDPSGVRSVPVVHDAPGATGYGFTVALEQLTPPARGYYLPGESVTFRLHYSDGAGHRLFAPGTLPTYGDMLARTPAANGLRYLNFTDLPILYWAHKALQGDLPVTIVGPIDRIAGPGTTPITPASLFETQITGAEVATDGYSSLVQVTPSTLIIFPCLYGLAGLPGGDLGACGAPVGDTFSFTLPADALPGTYVVATKARRDFAGEPLLRAASVRVQVGTATPTAWRGLTIPGIDNDCAHCHQGLADLEHAHHGFPGINSVTPECMSACHTRGYYFEPDADMITRLQIMHTASHRLGPPR